MPVLKKQFSTNRIKEIITGLFVSLLTTLLVCAAAAFLVSSGTVAEGRERVCAAFALVAGSALGAYYCAQKKGERFLVTALISGGVYALLRLVISAGSIPVAEGVSQLEAVTCIIIGSVIGGIPKHRKRQRRR